MNFEKEIEKRWSITNSLLDQAMALLCTYSGIDQHLEDYREYIKHNELELALDALEDAAIKIEAELDCIKEVWKKLFEAAESMELKERGELYRSKIQAVPD